MLLRRIEADPDVAPVRVNWDEITVRRRGEKTKTVWFADPRAHTRADCEYAFASDSTDEVLHALSPNGDTSNRPQDAASSVDRGSAYKLAAEGRES